MTGSARVLLHGRTVGELSFHSGGSTFRYTDDLRNPDHRVLGQIFEESPRRAFTELVGLPPWFANLLPEQGSGLRRYYAARFGERHLDDARLLLSLGNDLPGAVVVEPVNVPDAGLLVERAEARLDQTGVHLSALAGAQTKMSVLRDGDRLTLPASGQSGGWIAKFPDQMFPGLAENEYLMMRWARAAGIDVPEVDLVNTAAVPDIFERHVAPDSAVYLAERFDRRVDSVRVHIEDLAQVVNALPMDRDRDATYDGIGILIRERTGDDGFCEYLRRLVAMVLMGNCDAHLKNWSLWYPDGRTTQLAPAYDLVCTTYYRNLKRSLVFGIGGQTQVEYITLGDLRAVVEVAGFTYDEGSDLIRDTALAMVNAWPEVRTAGLLPELIEHIDHRLEHHPLLTEIRAVS